MFELLTIQLSPGASLLCAMVVLNSTSLLCRAVACSGGCILLMPEYLLV